MLNLPPNTVLRLFTCFDKVVLAASFPCLKRIVISFVTDNASFSNLHTFKIWI